MNGGGGRSRLSPSSARHPLAVAVLHPPLPATARNSPLAVAVLHPPLLAAVLSPSSTAAHSPSTAAPSRFFRLSLHLRLYGYRANNPHSSEDNASRGHEEDVSQGTSLFQMSAGSFLISMRNMF